MVNEGGDSRAEIQIEALFESADYSVETVVGRVLGTVDRFATPRKGLIRPRTYWVVFEQCPEDIEAALGELERARVEKAADRAMAIVRRGSLPATHAADAYPSKSMLLTLRRLALALFDIPAAVKDAVIGEPMPVLCLRRRGRCNEKDILDVVQYIVEWAQSDRARDLVILGPRRSGRKTVVYEAAQRIGRLFLEDPEHVIPLLPEEKIPMALSNRLLSPPLFIPISVREHGALDLNAPGDPTGGVHIASYKEQLQKDQSADIVELIEPSWEEVVGALESVQTDHRVLDRLKAVARQYEDFRDLLLPVPAIPLWHDTLAKIRLDPISSDQAHDAAVLARAFFQTLFSHFWQPPDAFAYEDIALGEFALPGFKSSDIDWPIYTTGELETITKWWISYDDPALPDGAHYTVEFKNRLVRDYFLARKIIREVRQGNLHILTRYQFPREFVLLFLGLIAPDVMASLAEDRSAKIQQQIKEQAEREVRLVMAHQLNRCVGALQLATTSLRKKLPKDMLLQVDREMRRMGDELDFLRNLAEQSRLLHQAPEGELGDIPLGPTIAEALDGLRQKYPEVRTECIDLVFISVQGRADGLREVFHCLLENAFHAVVFPPVENPLVRIYAKTQGEAVQVCIENNGPAIAPSDRENIFKAFLTTKKGGGRPQGTGLGLPIARKYAEHMGGRVELDVSSENTRFVVTVVRARKRGEFL